MISRSVGVVCVCRYNVDVTVRAVIRFFTIYDYKYFWRIFYYYILKYNSNEG